jgi:hypothetical protein
MKKPIDCSPKAQIRVLYDTLVLIEHMTDQRPNSSWVADTSDEVRIEAHQAASDALYKHYFPRKNAWDRIQEHGSTINWKMDCAHHDICPFCLHEGLEGGRGLVRSCANCKTHISRPGEQVWKHCFADPYERSDGIMSTEACHNPYCPRDSHVAGHNCGGYRPDRDAYGDPRAQGGNQ